jgi:CheY-like chemotaxis protein
MKVLVCEDNEVALKVIQVALNRLNIHPLMATDGRQALKILEEEPNLDLIITDIHMPFNNGDEILNRVRVAAGQATPIIMISSDANDDVIRIAKNSGVNEFIEKPFDPKVLEAKVKKLLKL